MLWIYVTLVPSLNSVRKANVRTESGRKLVDISVPYKWENNGKDIQSL